MTMDKSLRVRAGMVRARSVLRRAERITRLQESDRWTDASSPLGLPKVAGLQVGDEEEEKEEGRGGLKAKPPLGPLPPKPAGKIGWQVVTALGVPPSGGNVQFFGHAAGSHGGSSVPSRSCASCPSWRQRLRVDDDWKRALVFRQPCT